MYIVQVVEPKILDIFYLHFICCFIFFGFFVTKKLYFCCKKIQIIVHQ